MASSTIYTTGLMLLPLRQEQNVATEAYQGITASSTASATDNTTRKDPLKRFPCSWPGCRKVFTRGTIMRDHVDAEHKQITHICTQCGKVCRRRNELKQHISRVHLGLRPHVCRTDEGSLSGCGCGRSFATSSELYRHQGAVKNKFRQRPASGGYNLATSTATSGQMQFARTKSRAGGICAYIKQSGRDYELERTMVIFRNYASGSVDNRSWYLDSQGYIRTSSAIRNSAADVQHRLSNLWSALCLRDFKEAYLQMNLLCRSASSVIRAEDPRSLSELFVQYLMNTHRAGGRANLFLQSQQLIVRFFYNMSIQVKGQSHPWTNFLRFFFELDSTRAVVESLLEAMRATFDEVLGPSGDTTVERCSMIRLSGGDATQLEELVEQSSETWGRWHWTTRHCSDELLATLLDAGDTEALRRKVERIELELTSEPELDQTLRLGWTRSHAKWRYYICEHEDDWSEAAVFVVQLIEQSIELYGEDDPELDRWWLRLEEALEESGQFEHLREVKAARAARSQRFAAQIEEEERLEEEEWLASQAGWVEKGAVEGTQPWGEQTDVADTNPVEEMDWLESQAVQEEEDWQANQTVQDEQCWLSNQAMQEEQFTGVQQTSYGSVNASTDGWLTVLA